MSCWHYLDCANNWDPLSFCIFCRVCDIQVPKAVHWFRFWTRLKAFESIETVRDFGTWQVGILPFLPVPGLPLSGFGTCQTWRLATGPVGWLVRVFKVKIQWQCSFSLHWLVREGSKNQLLWLIEMIINNVIVTIFSIKFPIPPHKGRVCIVPYRSKRLGFCPLIWVDAFKSWIRSALQ